MEKYQCIYTLKTLDDNAIFDSREHAIPKALGGINMLTKGWVSDEANNLFSATEREAIQRDPRISIIRSLLGPNGRKNHKKSGVTIIEHDGLNKLGYLEKGYPKLLSQFVYDKNKSKLMLIQDASESCLKKAGDLASEILSNTDEPIYIYRDVNPKQYAIGIIKKQIYIGLNSYQKDEAENIFSDIKELIEKNKERLDKENESGEGDQGKGKLLYSNLVDLRALPMLMGKIVFNCLAIIKGHDFVIRKEFDKIRREILTLQGIEKDVKYITQNKNNYRDVCESLKIEDFSHMIIFAKVEGKLIGGVSLYGIINASVCLCEDFGDDFEKYVYYCDWMNNKEDFVMLVR